MTLAKFWFLLSWCRRRLTRGLKRIAEKAVARTHRISESVPILEGRFAELAMTFRREDIYGTDGR